MDPLDVTDAQLVAAARGGDQNAYRQLVSRYQGHVYGLAYSLVDHWADAQDIAQETFIRAYMNLDQLREPARFAAWLRRVAFGVTMNWIRAFRPKLFEHLDGRVDLDELDIPDFAPSPADVAEKRELAEAVLAAVASLPPKYRVPLTMFHLDGLSYQKVADFLDIPLGTAKSVIHRARAKLKSALGAYAAEEITPMVQEVFNEHKLPAEFASRVLENVPDIKWEDGECMLAGAVVACMDGMNDPVSYAFACAASGAAFELTWDHRWHAHERPSQLADNDSIRRLFSALGYDYSIYESAAGATEQQLREQIVASIDHGRPVIAWGIVGAPEPGVVTGYGRDGEVLLGHSYFHDGSNGYYSKDNWYKDCLAVLIVGEKGEVPPRLSLLRDTVAYAVEHARGPKSFADKAIGLAAYEPWADALRRDEDFPKGNLETLTWRCHVSNAVVLPALWDARKAAAVFLRQLADASPPAKAQVLQAAVAYEQEAYILDAAMKIVPFCHESEQRRLQMGDPELRHKLAEIIMQAKEKDQQAVTHLEAALKEM